MNISFILHKAKRVANFNIHYTLLKAFTFNTPMPTSILKYILYNANQFPNFNQILLHSNNHPQTKDPCLWII